MSKVLFTNLNLFDGVHDEILKHAWLLVDIHNGEFIKTGQGSQQPEADKVIDLRKQYVMPGLINVHTHISLDPHTATGDGDADIVTSTVRAVKHLHQLLKSGVTYIRECGCNHELLDIKLSQLEKIGKLKKVPEIMPAGQPMTMTGGHGILFGGGDTVDSTDEMRKAVRTNFANGAKCTKVMATGGCMSINDNMKQPQLTIPEMKVAVEETHHKGSIVAAHAEANPGIYNAIKAGVDSIEHGYYLTNKEIQMMLKRGTYLTPTLVAGWGTSTHKGLPKWEIRKSKDCVRHGNDSFRRAYKSGVKLTLGTDAGCPYDSFYYTPREFELLVKDVHMSNFDALSTSRHSAELLKLKNYGTLQVGKIADFLVLKQNPLANVEAVQQSNKLVYKKGIREY